jgi:hypothetical protein
MRERKREGDAIIPRERFILKNMFFFFFQIIL